MKRVCFSFVFSFIFLLASCSGGLFKSNSQFGGNSNQGNQSNSDSTENTLGGSQKSTRTRGGQGSDAGDSGSSRNETSYGNDSIDGSNSANDDAEDGGNTANDSRGNGYSGEDGGAEEEEEEESEEGGEHHPACSCPEAKAEGEYKEHCTEVLNQVSCQASECDTSSGDVYSSLKSCNVFNAIGKSCGSSSGGSTQSLEESIKAGSASTNGSSAPESINKALCEELTSQGQCGSKSNSEYCQERDPDNWEQNCGQSDNNEYVGEYSQCMEEFFSSCSKKSESCEE